ncbi:MAG TPA: hypothetical protein VGJ08_07025 [Rhizomicrobium sp.]
MKNPWIKKNPLSSIWMSGANAVFGAARSRAIGEAHRQTAIMTSAITKQALKFWGINPPVPARRKKRKSR